MLPTEWGKVRPASCRDKGRRGVDEGALCLSWWGCDRVASRNPDHSSCHQDKHKAQYISLKDLLTSLRSKRIKQVNKIKKLILRLKWLRWRHIALLRFILVVDLLDLPAVDT